MKEEILKQAIERLKDTKQEVIDKIDYYEEEIRRYKESNKEFDDVEINTDETEKMFRSMRASEVVKNDIKSLEEMILKQKNLVNQVLNYNLNFGDLDQFFKMVLEIDGFHEKDLYEFCNEISKTTLIKVPIKTSDISAFNQKRVAVIMKVDLMLQEKKSFGYTSVNKLALANEIKSMIRKFNMMPFYDKILNYLEANQKEVYKISEKNRIRTIEIRERELAKRKEEIDNNINELKRKIDECKKTLVSIGEIYDLYEEYAISKDQNTLVSLTEKLVDLVVISQRETKILKHEEKEKIDEPEEEKVEQKVEEKEEVKEVYTLDNDYFRRADTKHLICFLGEENDSIREDIIKHFDKSARKPVLSELYNLFNSLAGDADFIKDKGGNPHSGTSKNALTLLKKPFDFEYRRYGVRNDGFRIHAISRYSSLLKELGYGSGKIVFFGAIGVNDDKLKSDAYSRLGKRAIEERSDRGKTAKLRPNFDYIEHITRRYIPVKLLSDEDKSTINYIGFNGKTKGSIDTIIENKKYVLYDLLDEQSKKNVKDYLDEYFINQTTMLFDIIDDYKKGNTLD